MNPPDDDGRTLDNGRALDDECAAADQQFMRAAITLGHRSLGRTWPNPGVGCIIAKDGVVVGRGWTQPGGRPHAETVALAQARDAARGATAYVSLEPCAHFGKTPPCTQALINAGIARVVASLIDPDPRVNGQGLGQLERAGLGVQRGILQTEARYLHAGYIMRQTRGRPIFSLKLAQSMDGRIATASGQSQWITGPPARRYAHLLRAGHDAILIGSGTALADDPMLDCRIDGLRDRSPVRIVLDRRLRLEQDCKLVETAGEIPVWVVTEDTRSAHARALEAAGVRIVGYPQDGLGDLAALLGREQLTSVMIEGGGKLASAFIKAGLIDRIHLVIAPMMLGGDGLPSVAGLALDHVNDAPRWQQIQNSRLGNDRLLIYDRPVTD